MKRLILFLILAISFAAASHAQAIKFPFGNATTHTSDGDTIAVALTPANSVDYFTITNKTMDAALTVNLNVTKAKTGHILYIEVTADGTNRNLTFGTGMTGTVLTVSASKTFIVMAVFNGTKYVVVSTKQMN